MTNLRIDRKVRLRLYERDGYICHYCDIPVIDSYLIPGQPYADNNANLDHIFPVVKGGTDKPNNLVTACARCNSDKGTMTLYEYRMKQLFG